jgi:hypothetical protein
MPAATTANRAIGFCDFQQIPFSIHLLASLNLLLEKGGFTQPAAARNSRAPSQQGLKR